MFKAIADGFGYLFGLLWQLGTFILNGIWMLLQPVFEFIAAIGYFIYKLGAVLYKVLELVLSLAKLMIGLSAGLFKTLAGLSYSGSAASPFPASYNEAIANIQPVFATLQFNKIAYLLTFGIWLATIIIALRLIGGMRGAGGSE